ncbi:hypothetical protein [Leifsonia sp. 2MCAF36]|uniref:hypothetical protein n=1 Tax=Leifsonia sp. 2MCAF36 TaxID=3232988 RepID=UPI003F9A124F
MITKRTWLMATGVAAAVLLIVGATVLNRIPGPEPAPAADRATTSPTASAAPVPTHSPDAQSPEPATTAPPQSKRFTTEVIPGEGGAPLLTPAKAAPDPVSKPLPASASAKGKLVSGYPESVIPPAPGSKIATSAIATQGERLQASLTATTTLSVADLLAYYRTSLAKYGMYDVPAPASSGAIAFTFQRGDNVVTLTSRAAGGSNSYILYGAFTAKS